MTKPAFEARFPGAAEAAQRDQCGRWQKGGASPNPAGRPKIPVALREAAQSLTMEALDTLAVIMHDRTQSATARVMAAREVLNRAWGRCRVHQAADAASPDPLGLTDEQLEAIASGHFAL